MPALVLCLVADDPCARERVVRRRLLTGSPRSRDVSRRGEGLPGSWAVLFVRAIVEHPAGYASLLAQPTQRALLPSRNPARSASGKARGFGAAFPWPTRSRAYASPVPFLRPAQGSLPARAGSPFAGRVSHPLDDEQSFMKASPPPILFDQQGLVALHFLSSSKSQQRWLWHAIDQCTGQVLAYVFGTREDHVFLELKALLKPFVIKRFYTGGWGAYRRHIDSDKHTVGKQHTQKIERKHTTFRARIKRLVQKIICFSKSIQMHDLVMGLFINRFAYGRAV